MALQKNSLGTWRPSRSAAWLALVLLLLVELALPAVSLAQVQTSPPGGYSDKRFLRWNNFFKPRAYPSGSIPMEAYGNALSQRNAHLRDLSRDSLVPAINMGSWTSIGPNQIATALPDSGRLTTIAIHPTNPQIIYTGGAQGGVWKTTNGGTSWTPLTDQQCSLAMGSIAIDPANPQIVYAGTGELHFSLDSYYGCGVLRTTDGGTTWTQMGALNFDTSTGGARISKVVIDAATAGSATATKVFVASDLGLFRSLDSGSTWSLVQTGIITDLVADPANPSVLYAAVGTYFGNAANGVYKSTNGGTNWVKLAGGLPTSNVGRINLAIAPSLTSKVLATVQNSSNFALLGIYQTLDSGTNWSQLAATGASCGGQCWYDMHIQVHPTDPNTIYFGGVLLYKSTNGGSSFSNILNGIHVDQHAWAFEPGNPNTVYAGNDGGIFKSTNGGTSWTSLNTNLGITQFYASIALHPTDGNVILGGTQDNHTLRYNGTNWAPVSFPGIVCDGGGTAIDQSNPSFMYAQCQWSQGASYSGPRRSDSGTAGSFVLKTSGININDRAEFIPKIKLSPTTQSTVYFGTYRMYRSTNRGDAWTAISGDLTGGFGTITAFEEAAANPQVVYVGASDGRVHVTTNGGTTWTNITTGLPNRFITDVEIHPTNAATAYVTVSGFGSGHVWRTTNSGASWTNVSGNLPDIPINALVIDPGEPNTNLYVATDVGVYRTTDGGATWTPFSNGLAFSAVFDLAFNATTNSLIAATHGRGIWKGVPSGGGPALAVTPSTNFASSGNVGGPFSPSSTTYTVQNSGSGTMNWTVSSSNTSVATVSPAPVPLGAGASASVTVTIPAAANALAAGSYSSTLTFTNSTNGSGNTTRTASLTVNTPGGGAGCNDSFASATVISGAAGSISGSNSTATGQSGEPDHHGVSTPLNSVWCRWVAPATGVVVFDTATSSFDTTLAAYQGSSVAALSRMASNDDVTGGTTRARIAFAVVSGQTYYIAVDGYSGNTGNYTLAWSQSTSEATTILSAVLPYARSTNPGRDALTLGQFINNGSTTATDCVIGLPPGYPGTLIHQRLNPDGSLAGQQFDPATIPAGGAQGYVFVYTPTTTFPATNVPIIFDCANTAPASVYTGVNTFLVSSSSSLPPDLLMYTVTTAVPDDKILRLPGNTGTNLVGMISQNVGAAGTMTVSVDDGGRGLPLTALVCRVTPSLTCAAPPSPTVTVAMANNQVETFTVFVTGAGNIPADFINNRLYIRMRDSTGETRGATAVAVFTQGGTSAQTAATAETSGALP